MGAKKLNQSACWIDAYMHMRAYDHMHRLRPRLVKDENAKCRVIASNEGLHDPLWEESCE